MRINTNFSLAKRLFYTQKQIKPKICIVGAGPAGFYAAQHLVKYLDYSLVDIYERLPVPFGLVRFGVAPDHPEVKNVINTFTKTAVNPRVRFVGNVRLGSDISLKQLKNAYHVILLCYGADKSRELGIPGEKIKNVIEAKRIVGWYNGLPWDKDLDIDLGGEDVAIFGQGNVAVDVARILLTPIDILKYTDITNYSLEAISRSKIKRIHLIGRRGPLQAAFTIKELREMLKLQNCSTQWKIDDFQNVSDFVLKLPRPRKRLTELMLKSLGEEQKIAENEFKPIFFRSPLEIKGENQVREVILGINELQNDVAILTSKKESLSCDLAIPSIGYKSVKIEENLPFDLKKGIVPNVNGKIEKSVYVSGWLGTGPTGVIITTMNNAFSVAELILRDIVKESLIGLEKGGFNEIKTILKEKNVKEVSWEGWEKIDKYEQEEGKKVGKPREKVVDINKMLEIALN